MAGASKETSWHFDPKRIAESIFATTIGGILVAWATGVIGLNLSGNNGAAPAAVTTTEPPSHSTPSFVPGSSESNDDGRGPSETTPSFPYELPLATATPIGSHQDVAIDSTLQIDIGGKYRTFEATVGVSETAEDTSQVGTFVVYVDDVNKGTWQVAFDHHEIISVDVSGGIRLKLESSRDGDVGNPAGNGAKMAWGIKPDLPDLVWGTPRVVS